MGERTSSSPFVRGHACLSPLGIHDDEDVVAGDRDADGDIDLTPDVRIPANHQIVVSDYGVRRSELFMNLVYRSFEAFPFRIWFFWRGHAFILALGDVRRNPRS